jgi:hypothetical protein
VQKLASFSVGANTLSVELVAHLSHKVAGEMCFSLQLMFSVSVRACVSKFACSMHFEVFAQFGFFFRLVLLFENLTLVSVFEDSLLCWSGGFVIVFIIFGLAENEVLSFNTLCLLRIVFVISASGRCI